MTWTSSEDEDALEDSQAVDEEEQSSSDAEGGEVEGEEACGSNAADDSTSSEELMSDSAAKKGAAKKGAAKKGASQALATQTPARRPEITIFVSTKSGMAGRTQSKLRSEELGYDTRWADMKAAVLAKGQSMVERTEHSLENCCI